MGDETDVDKRKRFFPIYPEYFVFPKWGEDDWFKLFNINPYNKVRNTHGIRPKLYKITLYFRGRTVAAILQYLSITSKPRKCLS